MVSNSELRARARKTLGGQIFANTWLMALVVVLIAEVILGAASMFFIGTLLLTGPIMVGLAGVLLVTVRGKQPLEVGDLFKNFGQNFGQKILLGFMQSVFIFLWTLLFIIPGIVKTYAYSMSYYISVDHPDWEWNKCITESRRIMVGHKWKLFCLHLSFIGWAIVCIFTFGIGFFWLAPYTEVAQAEFYAELTGTKNAASAGDSTAENVVL